MSYEVKVIVTPQKGVLDPEAKTIEKCIQNDPHLLRQNAEGVNGIENLVVGKYFRYREF